MQILERVFGGNTINIMVDLETLGTVPGCKVISIGLASFNKDGIVTSSEILPKLSMQNGHEDSKTIEWWRNQSDEAKTVFARNELDGVSVAECSECVREFISLTKEMMGIDNNTPCSVKMWGNGATFDLSILQKFFIEHGVNVVWNTFGDRCYRTAMNILGSHNTIKREGVHHNAKDDAEFQALSLINAIKNADKKQ